jgi:CMP-N-acetylneuraminic acid synthetase
MIKSSFVAIIPARGGSKGIPKKNIIDVGSKPMLAWSVEASVQSKWISKTIVSSDSDEILTIAKSYGSSILKRPAALALDSSPTEPVIDHVLETLKQSGEKYDYLILLQPTSPLRNSSDIDAAIDYLLSCKATALISVTEPVHTPLKAFILNEEGYLKGLYNNEFPFMCRQDLPKVFMPNGAIYIIKIEEYLKRNKLFSDKTVPFEMKAEKSIDIDCMSDLDEVRKYLK